MAHRRYVYAGRPSASARALAQGLGYRLLRRNGPVVRRDSVLVNWGAGHYPNRGHNFWVFNHPGEVQHARNKAHTLYLLNDVVPVVDFTENKAVATEWAAKHNVFARHNLTGHSGEGIEVVSGSDVPDAPLYTKHFNALREYRVHVIGGDFLVQQKRRRNGSGKSLVRNHANGYVYCHDKVTPPPDAVIHSAQTAVHTLNLDFGAVDILVKDNGEHAVLEVNTAPGLEGRTLDFYVQGIKTMVDQWEMSFNGEQ